MSETIDLVVTRKVAGRRRGDIVTVSVHDARWASHIRAGNARALDPIVAPPADPVDLTDAPADDTPADDTPADGGDAEREEIEEKSKGWW